MTDDAYSLQAIGVVRSSLKRREDAPMQGHEGAPEATISLESSFAEALRRLAAGDEIIVITWLHLADRSVLQVHPRDDTSRPLTGVFATRSSGVGGAWPSTTLLLHHLRSQPMTAM